MFTFRGRWGCCSLREWGGGQGWSENFHFQGAMEGVALFGGGGGNFIRGDSYLLLWCRKGWGVRDDFTQVEWGAYFNI